MDDGDLHRRLLAMASQAQQQRHAKIQNGDVGNVFLPAIRKKSSVQSALSMKHLEVIEQCILAENRREEQLARCPSEKERRYLTKKFVAQREHERDLLQALMVGQPSDKELQIVDVTLVSDRSPLAGSRKSEPDINGVRGVHPIPDKLIQMHGEKTFTTTTYSKKSPTKSLSPNFHGIKSPERLRRENAERTQFEMPQTKKPAGGSPKRERPTRSASSPPKASPSRTSNLPRSLEVSPLRSTNRKSSPAAKLPAPSPSPKKRKKPNSLIGPPAPKASTRQAIPDTFEDVDGLEAITFEGVTSFEEARQIAMAAVHDRAGVVEGSTQTTHRSFRLDDEQSRCWKEQCELSAAPEFIGPSGEASSRSAVSRNCRPHSSPEPRRRRPCAGAHSLPSLAHSQSQATAFRQSLIGDPAMHKEDQLLAWGETLPGDEPSRRLPVSDELDLEGLERKAKVPDTEEMDLSFRDDARAVLVEDKDDLSTILHVLYDIIHQIEEPVEPLTTPTRLFEERTILIETAPETRRTSVMAFGRFVTRIQSAYRGYRTRREFRLALYQQALECGVLGAMPGTQQGLSGWYQDPKSFMAYYFAVQTDGEWVQKAVLRCSALVLTPYQMHEHILTRMPADLAC